MQQKAPMTGTVTLWRARLPIVWNACAQCPKPPLSEVLCGSARALPTGNGCAHRMDFYKCVHPNLTIAVNACCAALTEHNACHPYKPFDFPKALGDGPSASQPVAAGLVRRSNVVDDFLGLNRTPAPHSLVHPKASSHRAIRRSRVAAGSLRSIARAPHFAMRGGQALTGSSLPDQRSLESASNRSGRRGVVRRKSRLGPPYALSCLACSSRSCVCLHRGLAGAQSAW